MIKELANTKKVGILLNQDTLKNSEINNLITAIDIFTINNKEIFFYLFTNNLKVKSLVKKDNKNIIIEDINPSTYSDFKKINDLGINFFLTFNNLEYFNDLIDEYNKINQINEVIKKGVFFSNNYKDILEIEDSFKSSLNLYKKIKKNSLDQRKLSISYLAIGESANEEIHNLLKNLYEYNGKISFKDLFITNSNFIITDSYSLSLFLEVMDGLNELERINNEKKRNKRTIGEYFSKIIFSYQKINEEDINYLLLKIKLIFNFNYLMLLLPLDLTTNEYVKIFKLIKDLF